MAEEGARLFDRIVEFFERSRFDYLALEVCETSLRLSRDPAGEVRRAVMTSGATTVLSASVGFVEAPDGRAGFAKSGERVCAGEILFSLRRFKSAAPVTVHTDGILGDVLVKPGEFVAFGQELARVHTDRTMGQA